ncbi:hypothetical protein PIB30_090842 [Stylosanthes scabra]|uniref:Uncharacterized protein n=1 Tax=Stylosanthes scabra TaxID=79078 RepID=A0ABU6WST8_9FABA|nr:hypothetical protein [Stylosanthes scabra]
MGKPKEFPMFGKDGFEQLERSCGDTKSELAGSFRMHKSITGSLLNWNSYATCIPQFA